MNSPKRPRSPIHSSAHLIPLAKTDICDLQREYIRYVNSPGGLLAKGDLDAIRRYVLGAPDAFEMKTRQRALLEQSTTDIALWPGHASSGPSTRLGQTDARVVNASLCALPFVITTPMQAQILSHFDWTSPRAGGVREKLTHLFAQMLQLPPDNVQLLGALNVRNLLSTTPLQFHQAFRISCRRVSGQNSATPQCATRAQQSSFKCLMPKELPSHWESSPSQPQAYVIAALVAQELHESPSLTIKNPRASMEMAELLCASLAGDTSGGASTRADTMTLSPSKVQVARVMPVYDAITAAQGMELAWYAQYARKADLQFSMECRQEGPFTQVRINLTDDEGDSSTALAYCYDAQWRDPEHLSQIIAGVDFAQGTGQMELEFLN